MSRKVKTLQISNKLFILNGEDPIKYVDLDTDKVIKYKTKGPIKFILKVKNRVGDE